LSCISSKVSYEVLISNNTIDDRRDEMFLSVT
jgi:hypothetical protein